MNKIIINTKYSVYRKYKVHRKITADGLNLESGKTARFVFNAPASITDADILTSDVIHLIESQYHNQLDQISKIVIEHWSAACIAVNQKGGEA
jgi:hypothetical protein